MIEIIEKEYNLLLAYNPCEVFKHYGVEEMHGLNLTDCQAYNNIDKDAYTAGWCNLSPIDGKPYVFFNLTRMYNDEEMYITLFHEFMHLSFLLCPVNEWEDKEEEMITDAEMRTYKTAKIIKEAESQH